MDNNTASDPNINPPISPLPENAPLPVLEPTQTPLSSPPPPPTGQTVVSSMPRAQRFSPFTLFLGAAILLLVGIWGVVGYLYFQNSKTEGEPQEETTATETPSLENQVLPSQIQLSNGNIVQLATSGESTTLVAKEDYPGSGIIGFSYVAVSNDFKKLCFESIPPALEPALYVSDIDGTNVQEVAQDRRNCTWGSGADMLFYVNDPLGQKAIDIYSYDLNTKLEKNITAATQTPTEQKQYSIVTLSDNTLTCKYIVVSSSGQKLSESGCEVDLTSQSVSDRDIPTDMTTQEEFPPF